MSERETHVAKTGHPLTDEAGDRHQVTLPEGTVDLRRDLVPAVQTWLQRGLSQSFVRECVRVESFEAFSGGLKADLVGALKIAVNAVIKLGGPELKAHAELMRRANVERSRTCVEVVDVTQLDPQRWLLLMGRIKAETLYDAVYNKATEQAVLERAVNKVFEGLAAIHRVPRGDDGVFPETINPFGARIRVPIETIWAADKAIEGLTRELPGEVLLGDAAPPISIPPVARLLEEVDRWLSIHMGNAPRVLIHGDPHLRNAMLQRHGKTGISVRLIDPNPLHGFTDPAYDYGKLLHFSEPVGWALLEGEHSPCRATLKGNSAAWRLAANVSGVSKAATERQARIEQLITQGIATLEGRLDHSWQARVHIARASAHLGLVARLSAESEQERRLFVLAHALGALAKWREIAIADT